MKYVWVSRPWYEIITLWISEIASDAWFWMLGFGYLHTQVHAIPALGYLSALFLRFLFGNSTLVQTPLENQFTMKRKFIR